MKKAERQDFCFTLSRTGHYPDQIIRSGNCFEISQFSAIKNDGLLWVREQKGEKKIPINYVKMTLEY